MEESLADPALHTPRHITIGGRHGDMVYGLAGRDGSGSETLDLKLTETR